jgi:alpha-1,3-mannosyltransferase
MPGLGVPVGISTHGGYFHTRRHPWLKRAWLRTLTRATLQRADGVWFTSASDQQLFRGAGVGGTVMPNGVHLQDFVARKRETHIGHWLVPGRLVPHKGHAQLIRVVARLPPNLRPERLHVVGPDTQGVGRELVSLAGELGVGGLLRMWGSVSRAEMVTQMCRAELVLFPSSFEGFGLGVVEAQAAGCVVVANDIAAFCERITHGRDGHLVDFSRPSEVLGLVRSLREQHHTGAAARERAVACCWTRQVLSFEVAYHHLLEERCASA